jgi:DNA repair protein RecN (Recombination protein N)
MLQYLTIKNYALIRHLELQPSKGLNVITGETGAGKSIMLGALGLLMGNRADTKVLWDENEKCVIEATYGIGEYKLKSFFKSNDLDYDETTVIRREISPAGKSRAFINDTPVTLDVLRSIGNLLMDVHSQHETLQLGNQSFQLSLIDAFAGNHKVLEQYQQSWTTFLDAKHAFEKLTTDASQLREESDYIKFQLDELVKADLDNLEQSALESELKVMEHAEEIKNRFNAILDLLNRSDLNAQTILSEAKANLHQVSSFSQAYESLYKRLESVKIEIDDIADEIDREEAIVEFDPEKTQLIQEKLSVLYRLLKKHHASTIGDLITLRESLSKKNELTSNLDEALLKAEQIYRAAEKDLLEKGEKLSVARRKVFEPICMQVTKLLKALGIPNATLSVDGQQTTPGASGLDKVELLFSANKGISVRPLAQVASGGEFSRLMFAIKYIMAEKTSMPTLILDEIDNGVSGEIAIQLGNMMVEMSRGHQLITITHLPQIAAKGESHYFVFKDNSDAKTVSTIKRLAEHERVEEIAKMIGGSKPSKIALENAQELLAKT